MWVGGGPHHGPIRTELGQFPAVFVRSFLGGAGGNDVEGFFTLGLASEGFKTFRNGPDPVIFTTMGGGEEMAKSPPPGESPVAVEGVRPSPIRNIVAVGGTFVVAYIQVCRLYS